ncbi:alpha/beta-Hydrolases superfamily protein [Zea mays]|uniref:Alpha/beta-Hydrolases superfamily protein n=1 Tax=Zea mays TaxID=4577 RepID=A0A1D6PMQ8_MAIZE|nr:alpha/beta-Hydrolases superfamily protein [Zea mays]
MERLLWASTQALGCGGKRDEAGLVGQLGEWLCRAALPPPRVCGAPGGPPVTVRRVRLRDGRHLAYEESGVPKEVARYRIIFSHGFAGSRLAASLFQEVAEELGVYMVGFDRAGYGESDPNPCRSVRSAALDMEELADALGLGDRFYAVGVSLGCHAMWSALRYIPHRLAGAAMLAPVVNYWWPGLPAGPAAEAYARQARGDQWALRVAHHAPGLLHWWMAQRWLPTSTVVDNTTHLPNGRDAEVRRALAADGTLRRKREAATQQGVHESYHRDMAVMFGRWEFDPMDLPEPPCPVHLWQGDEDGLVPVVLQRHVAGTLAWVNYHELPGTGHFLSAVPGLGDTVLRTLFGSSAALVA